MIQIFKSLFGKKKEEEYVPDPPGRTFNKILTGKYFGCEDVNADEIRMTQAKQKKIDQIKELDLLPMFVRYTYKDTGRKEAQEEDQTTKEIASVNVVFQKETSSQKGQMTHITEVSFIINYSDFNEFEKMAGVSLSNDFRNLTASISFNGEERRREKRDR